MYKDLLSNGWKHKDIDDMDINHFLQIMGEGNENSTNTGEKKQNGKVMSSQEKEDWFKKI